jgi:hypothetical protein
MLSDLKAFKAAGEESNVEGRIITLFSEVNNLKTVGDSSAIKIANLGFKNIADVAAWITKNFSSKRYGLIMDPLLLLDRICGEAPADLKAIQLRINLKLTTGGLCHGVS